MRKVFNTQFKITQGFGLNSAYYSQFGLSGHEVIDLIPSGSDWTVLCLEDGKVVKDIDMKDKGGAGSVGRIRIEACSRTGTTNPAASESIGGHSFCGSFVGAIE